MKKAILALSLVLTISAGVYFLASAANNNAVTAKAACAPYCE